MENDTAVFNIFKNKEAVPQKIQLTLAWKNDKLYIQNNMACDILIEGVENGVQILDEERPQLDMEEIDKFSYDLPKLKSKGSAKLPGKEIFRMAAENIQLMGKKQAFVIAILLVTAVLLCITMAEFINSIAVDESSILTMDNHYIQADFTNTRTIRGRSSTWRIMEFAEEYLTDDNPYGEGFFMPSTNLYLTGGGYEQLENMAQLLEGFSYTDIKHLSKENLIYGRMPEKRNEVVIDKQLIEHLTATKGPVSTLYSDMQDYVGAKLKVVAMEVELEIVGVSDTSQTTIYSAQNVLLGMNAKSYKIGSVDELKAEDPEAYKDVKLEGKQILMRKGLLDAQGFTVGESYYSFGDDSDRSYQIVGTFEDGLGMDYVMTDEGCRNIRNLMMYETRAVYIYTKDKEAAIEHFSKESNGFSFSMSLAFKDLAKDQIAAYKEEHSNNVDAKNLITLAIVVISLVMVYFTIKSNAVSRSEELTVYRLIGISKGSILKSYMLEMIMVTSYTSLPAVLITSGVITFINSIPSLQVNMIFPWWSALILLVGIYLVHIIISIMPVYGILSKPPATLAVKE